MKNVKAAILGCIVGAVLSVVVMKIIGTDECMVPFDPNNYLDHSEKESIDKYGMSIKVPITAVFIYYGNHIEYDMDRRILIPEKVSKDDDYVRTLIHKSLDKEWFDRHIYLSPDSVEDVF